MKIMMAAGVTNQATVTFEHGDPNGRCEISATGIPAGVIPYTQLNSPEPTASLLDTRPVGFKFLWDTERRALVVEMTDPQYPARKGGRVMRITRSLVDDNTMSTVFTQTNCADNSTCGYTALMKRVI